MRSATALQENRRIDRALRRERLGRARLKIVDQNIAGAATRYPAGPFQAWLQALIQAEERQGYPDARQRVERLLKISSRRFSDWINAITVTEKQIDYACTRHGGFSIHDLYPDGPEGVVVAPPASITSLPVKPRVCSDPRCQEVARYAVASQKEILGRFKTRVLVSIVEDPVKGRFCFIHAERLGRLRADIEGEGILMSSNGGAPAGKSKPRHEKPVPTCCAPNCWNEREKGERFCEDCQAAGFNEGMYE